MSKISFEDWLHSSDEERLHIHRSWDVVSGEGKDIVSEIAKLLKEECVYNVKNVNVLHKEGFWHIEAFLEADDFENVGHRQNMDFLGFRVAFTSVSNQPSCVSI